VVDTSPKSPLPPPPVWEDEAQQAGEQRARDSAARARAREAARKRRIEAEETLRRRSRLEAEIKQLKESQRERGLEDVQIVMYVTSWCPACRKAVAWFQKSGISCDIRDIEKNRSWRRQLSELNPKRSIPTIKIGDEVLVGFSPARINAARKRAAGGS